MLVQADGNDDANAQPNNPLAKTTENDDAGEASETDVTSSITLGNLQHFYPINTYPKTHNGNHESGIGDLNLFAAYLFDSGSSSASSCIGPPITMLATSKDETGSDEWSVGLANAMFNASTHISQYRHID